MQILSRNGKVRDVYMLKTTPLSVETLQYVIIKPYGRFPWLLRLHKTKKDKKI